jgi:hypothetical protein
MMDDIEAKHALLLKAMIHESVEIQQRLVALLLEKGLLEARAAELAQKIKRYKE